MMAQGTQVERGKEKNLPKKIMGLRYERKAERERERERERWGYLIRREKFDTVIDDVNVLVSMFYFVKRRC